MLQLPGYFQRSPEPRSPLLEAVPRWDPECMIVIKGSETTDLGEHKRDGWVAMAGGGKRLETIAAVEADREYTLSPVDSIASDTANRSDWSPISLASARSTPHTRMAGLEPTQPIGLDSSGVVPSGGGFGGGGNESWAERSLYLSACADTSVGSSFFSLPDASIFRWVARDPLCCLRIPSALLVYVPILRGVPRLTV